MGEANGKLLLEGLEERASPGHFESKVGVGTATETLFYLFQSNFIPILYQVSDPKGHRAILAWWRVLRSVKVYTSIKYK